MSQNALPLLHPHALLSRALLFMIQGRLDQGDIVTTMSAHISLPIAISSHNSVMVKGIYDRLEEMLKRYDP